MWRCAAEGGRRARRPVPVRAAVLSALFAAGVVAAVVASSSAAARPGSQNMQDLHFLARQVAACYADGSMAFGQRVLHRRFVESFLAECEATSEDRRAIEADFAAPGGEACNFTRFLDVKERLSFERGKGRC